MNPNLKCDLLSKNNFTNDFQIAGSTGGFIKEKIVFCGGISIHDEIQDCNIIGHSGSLFYFFGVIFYNGWKF